MRTVSSSTLRIIRQRTQLSQRRFASSNTEELQKKSQEALSAAQKQAGQAWDATKKYAGPLADRVGTMLGSYSGPLAGRLATARQSLTYNLSVTREILKHIYVAERLQPPSVAEFKSAYAMLAQRLSNPAALREIFRTGEYARVLVYGLEAYGIFKIGEIVGRRSIVGYNVQ